MAQHLEYRSSMIAQQTVKKAQEVSGIGLHTGRPVKLVFKPAPENTGIYFVRTDLSGRPSLKAHSRFVKATQMATVLGGDDLSISTVEHVLSSVAVLGIDNLFIELEGPELPIGDGSALLFFEALKRAGIQKQSAAKKFLYVTKPVYFSQGDKHALVTPHASFKLGCTIEFPHPRIGRQSIELEVNPRSFERELAPARTFGFLKDVEALRARGLARGGSLENAIVLDDSEVINKEGLRFRDEFVRHKAMDAIGDLMMLGYPILGHVVLHKAGHDLLHGFVSKLLDDDSNYRIIELGDQSISQETEEYESFEDVLAPVS